MDQKYGKKLFQVLVPLLILAVGLFGLNGAFSASAQDGGQNYLAQCTLAYSVQEGDTMQDIFDRANVTADELVAMNPFLEGAVNMAEEEDTAIEELTAEADSDVFFPGLLLCLSTEADVALPLTGAVQEGTPEAEVEETPAATPEAGAEETPEAGAEETPEATPEADVEETPAAEVEETPEATPTAEVEETPEATPTAEDETVPATGAQQQEGQQPAFDTTMTDGNIGIFSAAGINPDVIDIEKEDPGSFGGPVDFIMPLIRINSDAGSMPPSLTTVFFNADTGTVDDPQDLSVWYRSGGDWQRCTSTTVVEMGGGQTRYLCLAPEFNTVYGVGSTD